jgi:hypothetical protein
MLSMSISMGEYVVVEVDRSIFHSFGREDEDEASATSGRVDCDDLFPARREIPYTQSILCFLHRAQCGVVFVHLTLARLHVSHEALKVGGIVRQ